MNAAVIPLLKVPSLDPIEYLLERLQNQTMVFNTGVDPELNNIRKWRAFRSGDKAYLRSLHPRWNANRPYKLDPLPKRMSKAFSDFLFNVSPLFTPADDGDRQNLVNLLRESVFVPKMRTGSDTCVSESEVWWRVYTDPTQSLYPIIEWHSRLEVRPLIYGTRVLAVAFVTDLGQLVPEGPHYQHLEIHAEKQVLNLLFRTSDATQLGDMISLSEHPLTENIQEVWNHDLPMLAGRVRNGEEHVSIYDQLEDLLLDLNEAHVVDSENFRLAGKKRAMIPKKYQDQAGNLDSGEEIFWTEDEWDEMESQKDAIKVMEYSYDSDASVSRKDDLERIILTRAGLVKQLVDSNANEGLAQTGTALRTRLLPGVAAIEGIEQEWQGEVPYILSLMIRVDALPESQGGWGREWKDALTPPAVEIAPPLPVDDTEEATRHSVLVTSNLESVEAAVHEMHQDWTVEQRLLEVRRILANANGYALDDQGRVVTADGTNTVPPPGPVKPVGVGQNLSGTSPGGGGAQLPPKPPSSTGAGVGAG